MADLLDRIKREFKLATEADERQREREREDLEFQVPENQWDERARKEREGSDLYPPRPMLSISLLTQPLQLIQNQAANARLGVDIHPVSEKADDELAEVKQGLYRRIERDSNAEMARLWALDRAKQCGRGWYRINTQYDEDGDDPWDQEISIERIYQQDAVYIDPSATKPDFSDARFGGVTAWVPLETFKEMWPKADLPIDNQAFQSWMHQDPEWVRSDGDLKAVLVAEHFYKEIKRETVEIEVDGKKEKRSRETVMVKYCKATGRGIIEGPLDWPGRYIPLIPVLGRELQPFDEERRWEGIVRQARDGQRLFNYAASTLVERMALEPKAPWVGAEGQFEGHEEEWGQSNTRNLPYLEYKPSTHEGNLVPPPQRASWDGSGMSLALMALQEGKNFVQAATAVYEPSLGELPADRTAQSGRAILALQQQSDAGTSHFLQSLAKISMKYEAMVILDLMPKVYDRPGRVTQILGAEDEPQMVMLGAQYVMQNDRPMPIQDGMAVPPNAKYHDLTQGKYSITVSIGKSYQTRLQEGQDEIGGALERNPQLFPIIGDVYYRFRNFPGHKEIADRLTRMRELQFPGLTEEEDGGMTLPQAMAQLTAMGQRMQEMEQALQAATMKLETDQAKQMATLQKTEMDNTTRELIARMDNMTRLLIEGKKAESKAADDDAKREFETVEREADRQHENERDEFEAAHEATMAVVTGKQNELREPNKSE